MRNKMTNTKMNFDYLLNSKCIMGEFYLYADSSLVYAVDNGGFNVLLGGNWAFSLIVNYEDGRCEGFETLLDALKLTLINTNIDLPSSQKGELFFTSEEELNRGAGCYYIPFQNTAYYDSKKQIVCLGAKDSKGVAVEFANGIIAVVDDRSLVSLYLDLKGVNVS